MDRQGFARFYAMTRPTFFRFARRLCDSDESAEDLVQDACCQALAAIDSLRDDASIKAWIFTIMRNRLRNELRRNACIEFLPLHGEGGDNEVFLSDSRYRPDRDEVQRPFLKQVARALAGIPRIQRTALLSRDLGGESYATIAGQEGTSIGTVRSRIHRARMRLRRSLATAAASAGLRTETTLEPAVKHGAALADNREKVYLQV